MKLNKRGNIGNQLMAVTFFASLLIIGIGIVAGVSMVYGDEYDFREVEAEILNYNIRECIFEEGLGVLDDFYEECRIDKDVLSDEGLSAKVCVDWDEERCLTEEGAEFSVGSNFEACGFEGTEGNEGFGKCVIKEMSFGGESLVVITSSNQKKNLEVIG